MTTEASFRINEKIVVHENFDDEVLAVNTDTGTYYSLTGAGAQVWRCLIGGATAGTAAGALGELYVGEPAEIVAAVADFLGQLSRENLVVAAPSVAAAATPQLRPGAEKKPFVAPAMEIFTDMQDLLLLDPIHEVDEAGWPLLKPVPDAAGGQ